MEISEILKRSRHLRGLPMRERLSWVCDVSLGPVAPAGTNLPKLSSLWDCNPPDKMYVEPFRPWVLPKVSCIGKLCCQLSYRICTAACYQHESIVQFQSSQKTGGNVRSCPAPKPLSAEPGTILRYLRQPHEQFARSGPCFYHTTWLDNSQFRVKATHRTHQLRRGINHAAN